MSSASNTVIELVKAGKLRITEHGQEALLDDGIGLDEILLGIADAHEIEYYPDAFKGPSVLLLQKSGTTKPFMFFGVCLSPMRM